MKKKIQILIIMISLIVVMTGCIAKNQSSAKAVIKEGDPIHDTYKYNVKDSSQGIKLKINLLLTKGTVEFELKDPNGNIKWSGKATSEMKVDEVKEFEKITGEWGLTFNSIDNSGEGSLKLRFDSL